MISFSLALCDFKQNDCPVQVSFTKRFLSWGLEKLTINVTTLLHLAASSSSYSYENLMINPLLKATLLLRFTDYPSFLFFSFLPFYIPFLLERHRVELHQWSNDLFTNSLLYHLLEMSRNCSAFCNYVLGSWWNSFLPNHKLPFFFFLPKLEVSPNVPNKVKKKKKSLASSLGSWRIWRGFSLLYVSDFCIFMPIENKNSLS